MTTTALPARPRERRRGLLRGIGGVVLALAGSAVAGALTPIGQQYLPEPLAPLANSSGSWTVIAFAAVYLSRTRPVVAAVLGAACFVLMNELYGVVSTLRGYPYTAGFPDFWNLVAIVVGPVVGLAAAWLRSGRAALLVPAIAAPSAVLLGEGVYYVTVLGVFGAYGFVEIGAGVLLLLVLVVRRVPSMQMRLATVALALVGAAAFVAAYTLVPAALVAL
ncbi:DUF6518 family protein [Planctomonas deserti]|uniref:DUF6518 family protein n=1 Tax=Planctomonas deserti TaxID=2144185 RepID=UPI000D343B31|nr:DUF6518 family protein [Planctomonas deserti]